MKVKEIIMDLKKYIATIPDFPKPGIQFRDVTTIFDAPEAFNFCIEELEKFAKEVGAQAVAGAESRGFVFGAPIAKDLGLPFIAIRKPGKLPRKVISESYNLEYGSATLEMNIDAVKPGQKVLIIDDLLATGGTALAACHLVEKLGGKVVGCGFVINLPACKGEEVLKDYKVKYLVEFDGD